MTATVTSGDGTPIAFDTYGTGSPVLLVGGAVTDRTTVAALAATLGDAGFQAVAFDRRGRGDSGDAPVYTVEREIDDLASLLETVGGSAAVFGHSSGAILSLEAAARGLPITKVAVYEPPFIVADERQRPGDDLVDRVSALVADGDRDGAVELFLTEGTGASPQAVAEMRDEPVWGWFTGLAHTLPYDLTVCGPGNRLPADRLAAITVPVLSLSGGAGEDWMTASARAVAAAVAHGRHEIVAGQDHGVLSAPDSLRGLLTGFLR
ncbi:alpha/beta fold hydrolase [Amycolatopsis jiangsuensis]|uniref:Pimeloyl-ACP methyl ester carboxylesterase n=1 Tax=Amycolatopsis jiangsuensis TaxID=1181879 RepID=A0A840IS78_9PSEU|nr:alpha/beta hydrolase [Amycolatopsis jiangsuensis]MBB4685461.1 pimeloyl-ACP methyl ester carboxylesterase [Amycolatopsis jiangsuensis]